MAIVKPTRERLAALEAQSAKLKADIAFCREIDKLDKSGVLKVVRENLKSRIAAIEGRLDNFIGMEHDQIIALLQNRLDIRAQARMYESQSKRIESYQRQLEALEKQIFDYRKKLKGIYG